MHIKYHLEDGRTILEILIVVALCGLLSLLPLEIYDYAIDKHRSNTLKDEILQRSADIKNQIDHRTKRINLDKWDTISKTGVPINLTWETIDEHKSVGIQVQRVDKRLCNMMLDGMNGLAKIKLNNSFYTKDISDNCEDSNEIVFHFEMPSENIKTNSINSCPLNTPKGADPDTCQCDLNTRYFQEATNECICWSEVEINGECATSCATSSDCDKNEVCENHICIRYEHDTTTTEVIYTSKEPQTTDILSTTPETTTLETSTLESTYSDSTSTSYPRSTTTTWTTPETTTLETSTLESTYSDSTSTSYPRSTTTTWTTPQTTSLETSTLESSYSNSTSTSYPHSTTTTWTTPQTTSLETSTLESSYSNSTSTSYPYSTTTTWATTSTDFTGTTSYSTTTSTNYVETTSQRPSCPASAPYWNGSECTTCANIDYTKPYWDTSTQTCMACPSSAPYWNGSQCITPTSCSTMGLYNGLKITYENAKMWSYKVGERYQSLHIYGVRDGVRVNELTLEGYIYAPQNGTYTFRTHDGCSDSHNKTVTVKITIDNQLVHQVTSACSNKKANIYLTAGLHSIHYYMYTLKRSTAFLDLQTSGALLCSM